MKIICSPLADLTADQLAAWSQFQSDDPELSSPYFRPEFAQAVDAVQKDVEIAVLEVDGAHAGFWPFQRTKRNAAKPVGGGMSDFHGVICRKGLRWNAEELIRGCGLTAWDFDHLLASQQAFRAYHWKTAISPYMDLSGGFDRYRGSVHGQAISTVLRKGRKLDREVGPLRLEAHTADSGVFKTLMQWKVEQYPGMDGATELLESVLDRQHEAFSGMLTALYAGDQLAAAHFGMRSRHVLHYWVPAYNKSLQKYSPGLVLLTELAKSAAELGIQRIDLGRDKGRTCDYKSGLMSSSIELAEGFVACRPMARWLRHGSRSTREWLQSSPLRRPARVLRDKGRELLRTLQGEVQNR